jgi:hypothetical protein
VQKKLKLGKNSQKFSKSFRNKVKKTNILSKTEMQSFIKVQ